LAVQQSGHAYNLIDMRTLNLTLICLLLWSALAAQKTREEKQARDQLFYNGKLFAKLNFFSLLDPQTYGFNLQSLLQAESRTALLSERQVLLHRSRAFLCQEKPEPVG
jgi:hypothetical protein